METATLRDGLEMKHVTVIALETVVLRTIYAKIRRVRHLLHKQMRKRENSSICLSFCL